MNHFRQNRQIIDLLINLFVIMVLYVGIIRNIMLSIIYGIITLIVIKILEVQAERNEKSSIKGVTFQRMILIWNIESILIVLTIINLENNWLYIYKIVIISGILIIGLFILAKKKIITKEIVNATQIIGMVIILVLTVSFIIIGLLLTRGSSI
ncbi:MAG: hypothetical protein ACXAC7_00340 [Candidatus Hodarchaeales archaeon]